MMLFSDGAPLTPVGGSSWSLVKTEKKNNGKGKTKGDEEGQTAKKEKGSRKKEEKQEQKKDIGTLREERVKWERGKRGRTKWEGEQHGGEKVGGF